MMKIPSLYANDPLDDEEIRLEKISILLIASSCCIAGILWTAMYYFIFGWSLTTALPLAFFLIVGGAIIISHVTKYHYIAFYAQLICIIYIPTFIQWSIGGLFDSGFVMIWSFIGPLCTLMILPIRKSIPWFGLFLLNIGITLLFNDFFAAHGQIITESTGQLFFAMNLSISSLVVFVFATYYVATAKNERDKANSLLLNVLPKEIAPTLKASNATIAEYFPSASVLFADIVGSTKLFTDLPPNEAVDWLNEIFSMFDPLVEKYGLEKIRTIGDNYMVAAGVPTPSEDHAIAIAHLALDMIHGLKQLPARNGKRIEFRLGINSGPLVAGVIGKTKFHYDLWGDTVNMASRMESHGEVGKIQISEATYQLILKEFVSQPRGEIPIKGKGNMKTWFLIARNPTSAI